jgi:hypothetical protein
MSNGNGKREKMKGKGKMKGKRGKVMGEQRKGKR